MIVIMNFPFITIPQYFLLIIIVVVTITHVFIDFQVDQVAAKKGLVIAGYYMANENLNDLRYTVNLYQGFVSEKYVVMTLSNNGSFCCSIDRPAHRIADKIAESFNGAVMVVVSIILQLSIT